MISRLNSQWDFKFLLLSDDEGEEEDVENDEEDEDEEDDTEDEEEDEQNCINGLKNRSHFEGSPAKVNIACLMCLL